MIDNTNLETMGTVENDMPMVEYSISPLGAGIIGGLVGAGLTFGGMLIKHFIDKKKEAAKVVEAEKTTTEEAK